MKSISFSFISLAAFHSRQNSETFDVLHAFLSLVVAKLSDLKNSPVFLAHPVHVSLRRGKQSRLRSSVSITKYILLGTSFPQ